MNKKPFKIFSWHQPFLPSLKEYIDSNSLDGRAVVIVPNSRPWRYFLDLYASEKAPRLVPRMFTISDAQDLWRDYSRERPSKILSSLDQAGALYECVKDVCHNNSSLERAFAKMGAEEFLPWGYRLADLFEEMFIEGARAKDIAAGVENVGEIAAPLLNSLALIMNKWRETLESSGLSTPGLEAARAADSAADIPEIFSPANGKEVFVAGFYKLNGVEKKLIRALWENGAHICLHTDPAILEKSASWAAQEHENWIKKWSAAAELVGDGQIREPSSFFFSGYDAHSQLKEFRNKIARDDGSKAVILTHPGLLMPTLHHLPDKNVNISMGYPLNRGAFASLIDCLFALKFSRKTDGDYYWRDIVNILKHPYMKTLNAEGEGSLGDAFAQMENKILNGYKFVNINGFYNEAKLPFSPNQKIVLDSWKKIVFDDLRAQMTLAEFASFLESLFELFSTHGGNFWDAFSIDSEILRRIRDKIIPELKDSRLVNEKFDLETLYFIATEALNRERAAFRADPIMGTQILGLLETRLLQFDKLYIMDATEDVFPGSGAQNPLLPDSLRGVLGLSDISDREKTVAHNLARLRACAREVNYFWQESVAGPNGEKKFRSRFVEEQIWKEERRARKVFEPGVAPLNAAVSTVKMRPLENLSVKRTDKIAAAVKKFLAGSISPTALDLYMDCPLKFINHYLLKISAPAEVVEDEDASLIGECVHKALENLLKPYINKEARPRDTSWSAIGEELAKRMDEYDLKNKLPMSSWLYFQIVAPQKLKKFFEGQPESAIILGLEKKIKAELSARGEPLKFQGRIDRIDLRDGKIHILDYKTGHIPKCETDLWRDAAFFDELKKYARPDAVMDPRADEALVELKERIGSLQLPAYIMMLKQSNIGEIGDAAFVDLADTGKEIALFENLSDEEKELAIEHCETALAFVARHLLNSLKYEAREGVSCDWCDYKGGCKIPAPE